jgi:hypothetical protein
MENMIQTYIITFKNGNMTDFQNLINAKVREIESSQRMNVIDIRFTESDNKGKTAYIMYRDTGLYWKRGSGSAEDLSTPSLFA